MWRLFGANFPTGHKVTSYDEYAASKILASEICGNLRNLWMILLVAQRFDWVEGGGFARRIESKENANRCTEQKCNSN